MLSWGVHAYRPDHYAVLGVASNADGDAIRAAYVTLAKQHHPDASDAGQAEATARFLRLQEAYDTLRDPMRRAQFDAERARQAAMAQAARHRVVLRPAPPLPVVVPKPRRRFGAWVYIGTLGLVLTVTVAILVQQRFWRPRQDQITVIRVEADSHGRLRPGGAAGPGVPSDPGILSKEIDRSVRQQMERVEAAKQRMEAQQLEMALKDRPAPPTATGGPTMRVAKVECAREGRTIVLTRESDGTRISYEGEKPVVPRVSDLGTGTVLVSRIEPTNKIAIAFTKGDLKGTSVLIFDGAGSVSRTFSVDCNAAAF